MKINCGNDSIKSKFIFDHIQKTAGTALRSVFEAILGADQVSPPVIDKSLNWAIEKLSSYRMIIGHFMPLPYDGLDDGRAQMTVLRHPIDRALSEYFFLRNDAASVSRGDAASLAKRFELDDALARGEGRRMGLSNRMSRHFAMRISLDLRTDEQILSLAKTALSHYDFVGLYEHLADTVDLLCLEFCLPPALEIPKLNVTTSRMGIGDLNPETLDRLTELNSVDLALYDYALSLFEERKREILRRVIQIRYTAEVPATSECLPPPPSREATTESIESMDLPVDLPVPPPRPECFGDRRVEIREAQVFGSMTGTNQIKVGEETTIRLVVVAHEAIGDLVIGIKISDRTGEPAFGINTELLTAPRAVAAESRHELTFSFPANLNLGPYFVTVAAHSSSDQPEHCFHWWDGAASFDVVDYLGPRFAGYSWLDTKVDWIECPSDSTVTTDAEFLS